MTVRKTIIGAFAILLAASIAYTVLPENVFAAAETPAEEIVIQTPPAIRVVAAAQRELVEHLSVTGTIVAREEAAAGTDLNGLTVLKLNADQGDRVKKGDVLAVLDRSSLETQLAQMDASRAQAEANIAQMEAQIADSEVGVRQAKEGLARSKTLQAKGVAAKAQLDNAVNAFDSARARLGAAQKAVVASQAQLAVIDAQKKNISLQLGKTDVKAPADGLVLARSATLGGIVSAAAGPLFRIAIDGEFELAATVAETALPRLKADMPVAVMPAGSDTPIAGNIRRISPEVDQRSRLGTLYISIADSSDVRVGNFARGEIEAVRRNGVAVPEGAVTFRNQKPFLQVVRDGKVNTVPVTLGARAEGYVEVKSGVTAGDEVIERAGTFVADGDMVTPVRGDVMGALKP
ncbi:efflux RND transporter periplasmic adaptor subunit [Mesorhizobium sp. NBSH29]|uniref:efflux RND transporter periplasmic adaptor subunit n=1 Tax=Mesorhizobium sp. NBSH29 TaxID=2654249 RepID=UPI0018966019|nr:efflux RND transporter periplasmic adaptor subunit [Mesorhizobium sp. NBSH29]QPC85566.1 efflux RND transporter periplasmic adaptor subunit [Mesorhizobium sp. NBSH29]